MDNQYIKIRKSKSDWEDTLTSYHYANTVNIASLVVKGKKFVLERKIGKIWYFVGHGIFGEITEEEGYDDNRTHYRVLFDEYNEFEPTPNVYRNQIIEDRGDSGPAFYNNASILNLTESTYNSIVDQLKRDEWSPPSTEYQTTFSPFHLWLVGKYSKINENEQINEAALFRYFRNSFPYLTDETERNKHRLLTGEWIGEDSIKDNWQPRRWGCVQDNELFDKSQCQLVCEYSPQKNEDKSCKEYGSVWMREDRSVKLSGISLDVIDQQVIEEKISFDELCRYLINRDGSVNDHIRGWVQETFHLSEAEMSTFFQLETEKKEFRKKLQLRPEEEEIKQNLLDKRQVVLYGPPGTGKTFSTKRIAKNIVYPEGESNIEFIQFHPSYTYENFVQGFFPTESKEGISYDVKPGHFKKICDLARKNEDQGQNFCIVIDEINRANLTKVLGELFYSIEHRGEDNVISLALSEETQDYEDRNFYVPQNLYIIGTMNTADRSLADIDVALRRRFRFIEMMPNTKILREYYASNDNDDRVTQVIKMFEDINEELYRRLGTTDLLIGHTYFMLDSLHDRAIRNLIFYEIIPLLQDYFHQDREIVASIMGEQLFDDMMTMKPPTSIDIDNYLENF